MEGGIDNRQMDKERTRWIENQIETERKRYREQDLLLAFSCSRSIFSDCNRRRRSSSSRSALRCSACQFAIECVERERARVRAVP